MNEQERRERTEYIRDDSAVMIELEPHVYVNKALLHLVKR